MSNINRNGKSVRPEWIYVVPPANQVTTYSMLEMMESVRNAVESVRASQMMQCDVAHAIKNSLDELRKLNREIRALRRDLVSKSKRKR